MNDEPGMTRIAGLLAHPARMRMLLTLADRSMRPAGELAFAASISAQAASAQSPGRRSLAIRAMSPTMPA